MTYSRLFLGQINVIVLVPEKVFFFQDDNGNGNHHLTVTTPMILGNGTRNYSEVLLDSGVGSDLGVDVPQHHQVAARESEANREQQHLLETAL
jgi:hypothetical protein